MPGLRRHPGGAGPASRGADAVLSVPPDCTLQCAGIYRVSFGGDQGAGFSQQPARPFTLLEGLRAAGAGDPGRKYADSEYSSLLFTELTYLPAIIVMNMEDCPFRGRLRSRETGEKQEAALYG